MRLIKRNPHRMQVSIVPQIHAGIFCRGHNRRMRIMLERHRIKKLRCRNHDIHCLETGSKPRGQTMHAFSNPLQTLRPVIHRIHARHHRE